MHRALLVLACACHGTSSAPPPAPADKPAATPKLAVGVDLPVLADDHGTVPADPGATVTISAKTVVLDDGSSFPLDQLEAAHLRQPDYGPVTVRAAVARTTTVHTFDAIFAEVIDRDFELLVRTPSQVRAVRIERWKAMESDTMQTLAVVSVGDTIRLNGAAAGPTELAAIHADRVVIVPEPSVTMQRLAEVIAMTGGRATLGAASLPAAPVPAP